jgi:glycosyltransferase involved in cell wall biosynthesis
VNASKPLIGLRVAHFGHHDPNYARNRILAKALRRVGADIIDISHRRRFPSRTPRLILDALKARADVILVGFPGHSDLAAAKLTSLPRSVPIVFDALVSLWETSVLDRGVTVARGLSSMRYRITDRIACSLADVVLLDTDAHIQWFVEEFRLPVHKFRRIWVGADDEVMKPCPSWPSNRNFTVFFYGSYIPLHGIEHILGAAQRLGTADRDVRFILCGSGQTYPAMRRLAARREINNVRFLGWRPLAELRRLICESDLCLGIFGTSKKAQLVVPNKVFDALACQRPVITADTPAARECLVHGRDAWFCKAGDADALAESIATLKADPGLRGRLADEGRELFHRRFSLDALANDLWPIFREFN